MTSCKSNFLTGVITILLFSTTAFSQDEQQESTPPSLPLEELRMFTQVFDHIRQVHVEDIDDATLLKNAIIGMLAELDPHSAYLDEESFDDLQISTSGEFGGLGIEVSMEDGFVKVISPIDDTPAHRAGIEAGDLIIKLDTTPVKGMTLQEAVDIMRGPKGSDITLTIIREGEDQPLEKIIVRDLIKVVSVRSRLAHGGFGYVRIAQFQSNTGEDLEKEIGKLTDENDGPLQGLVLDLRNNPGGVLQAAIAVSDAFLEEGLIVYTKGRIPHANSSHEAKAGDLLNGAPIVVLINDGSASASEIVAGALQDHQRAIILGTTSFGKGSVQTVIPLSEERAIKLTTARYYTPKGNSIQAEGIVPDIKVERARIEAIDNNHSISEADLAGHLSNDKSSKQKTEDKNVSDEFMEIVKQDNQLHDALNVLKAIYLSQQANLGKDNGSEEEATPEASTESDPKDVPEKSSEEKGKFLDSIP